MSTNILPLLFRAVNQYDWTQQELAEFYRVETVLIQSGVSLETERGLSDEGDPWFVFCRPQTGDVVIHFARYGNEYVAAGGGLDGVLRGRSFRDIIDSFMSCQPMVVSRKSGLETQVVLHPTALLSAFVTTAFFLFMDAEADAAPNISARETPHAPPAAQARVPAVFQTMIEAAGLVGNRDAWLALSTVAIAFSIDIFDFRDSNHPEISAYAHLQEAEGAAIEVESLGASVFADDKSLAPRAIEKWTSIDSSSTTETVLPVDSTDSMAIASIISSAELAIDVLRPTDKDPLTQQYTAIFINTDATTTIEPENLLLLGALDDSLGDLRHLTVEKSDVEGLQIKTTESKSEAYSLLLISLDTSHNKTSTGYLTTALIDALMPIPHAVGIPQNDFSAEINFATKAISLSGFKTEGVEKNLNVLEAKSAPELATQAIEWFTQNHPDFKVVSLGRSVVVFDWSTSNQLSSSIELHTWTMHDGSTINIIGSLPDAFSIDLSATA